MPRHPGVRFRSLRIADYEAVHSLWRRSRGVGLNESDTKGAIALYLRRNPGLSLVAVASDGVIGAVLCGHDGRRGYLHHLAVDRKWRKKGIGGALVSASLERLAKQGILKCNIFLLGDNKEGRVFWQRIGWTERPELRLVQTLTAASGGSSRTSC
jgi:N-acetylglutamate synthase